jgi:SAM-dependent methyltransferase
VTVPERDTRFVGTVPEMYDRHLGPMFFAPFARDLAARLELPRRPGASVLEVAAGTGILTEELRRRLPADVQLVASDLNAPMLAVARRRLASQTLPDVAWQEADATSLPFGDRTFDAVLCQFGVMFFPDKPRAAREAFRVLRRGGRWLFNVWGSFEDHPVTEVAHRVISAGFTHDAPDFYRTPVNFHDRDALRALAGDAGFVDVSIDDVRHTAESPTALDAAIGLVHGNPVVATIVERGGDPVAVARAVADALAKEFGDAPMRAPMMGRVVSARRP